VVVEVRGTIRVVKVAKGTIQAAKEAKGTIQVQMAAKGIIPVASRTCPWAQASRVTTLASTTSP